jgi:hypothetical protein
MYFIAFFLALFATCSLAFVPARSRVNAPRLTMAAESVTQTEMIDMVSGMTGSTKAATKATLDAFVECLKKSVFEEEKEYKVPKFGSFKPKFSK